MAKAIKSRFFIVAAAELLETLEYFIDMWLCESKPLQDITIRVGLYNKENRKGEGWICGEGIGLEAFARKW